MQIKSNATFFLNVFNKLKVNFVKNIKYYKQSAKFIKKIFFSRNLTRTYEV
jgi:hypothetical protein